MEITDRLVEVLVILVAAKLAAEVMTRIRQPAVIGELIIGMVIGGSMLGWITVDDGGVIAILAEIGVVLLLFEVGLETDVRDFVRLGPRALSVASIGVATPFILGFFGAKMLDLGGGSTEVAIFTGAAMTATSVGITARVFADLRRIQTDEAKTIIGAAVIDDVMGLIILAVVVGLLGEGGFQIGSLLVITAKAIAFLGGVVALGSLVIRPYLRVIHAMRVEGSYVVGAFVFTFVVAVAAERLAGLDPIVGAFAAGLVAAQSGEADRIYRELRPVVYLFVPIFFVAIGARVDVGILLDPAVLGSGLVIAALAIVGKLAAAAGVWGEGINRWVVGVGMIPRGEVGLIFAALGADQLRSVVGPEETAIIVLMVLVTTILAPLVLNRMLKNEAVADDGTPQMHRALDSPIVGGPEIEE